MRFGIKIAAHAKLNSCGNSSRLEAGSRSTIKPKQTPCSLWVASQHDHGLGHSHKPVLCRMRRRDSSLKL